MPYDVKEMILTLQGEGARSGMPVVLCRFRGCNLDCSFCDTEHEGETGRGGGSFHSGIRLADAAAGLWRGGPDGMAVLLTGGEPLLQVDDALSDALHARGFTILLETNGTLPLPRGIDWVCVSPKSGAMPVISSGDELKLAFPEPGVDPAIYLGLDFDHFYIQPIWGENLRRNMRQAVEYCLQNPVWSLSIQMHKFTGIP
jgi:7-carboxy-7-deazaguanine synthase (Cx14CxxC type)